MEAMSKICDGVFMKPEKITDLCHYFRVQVCFVIDDFSLSPSLSLAMNISKKIQAELRLGKYVFVIVVVDDFSLSPSLSLAMNISKTFQAEFSLCSYVFVIDDLSLSLTLSVFGRKH